MEKKKANKADEGQIVNELKEVQIENGLDINQTNLLNDQEINQQNTGNDQEINEQNLKLSKNDIGFMKIGKILGIVPFGWPINVEESYAPLFARINLGVPSTNNHGESYHQKLNSIKLMED